MRTFAGPDAAVEFTHLSRAAGESLVASFAAAGSGAGSLARAGCHRVGVLDLMKERGVPLERVCLLDPKAGAELAPEDGEKFEWFLFGVSSMYASVLGCRVLIAGCRVSLVIDIYAGRIWFFF